MCMICDGASEDEVLFGMHAKIGHYGYTMTMVEAEPPWTYTIGLATRPHPELVTTGLGPESSVAVISAVADRIRNGARFDERSDPLDLDGLVVRFGPVHDEQWRRGRFNDWFRYYEALGHASLLPTRALQILWPDEQGRYPTEPDFCGVHRDCQPLLSDAPRADVNGGSNRAARRQHARARRRRPPGRLR